ncbi:MAG: right-handed parallel beta-helix repeat-containing protein [Patescibacteria group bacterium]
MRYFISKISLFFILTGSCILIAPVSVSATTYIDSRVTQSMEWTKDNSPYVIQGDVYVPKDVIITVQPGVIIKFDNGSLDMEGSLYLLGNENDKIIVTSFNNDIGGDTNEDLNNSLPSQDDIGGIFFRSSQPSILKNIVVRYINNGISAKDTQLTIQNMLMSDSRKGIQADNSRVHLINSSIENIPTYGLTAFNHSSVDIASTTIQHSDGGITLYNSSELNCIACIVDVGEEDSLKDGINVFNNSIVKISDSTISYHGMGSALAAFNSSNFNLTKATLLNSTITGSLQNAVLAYSQTNMIIASSTIQDAQESGLMSFNGAHITVTSSIFQNNKRGIELHGVVGGSISHSSIKDNHEDSILSTTEHAFDARNNWWGDSTGPNPEPANVLFTPWLLEDPEKKDICCSNVLFLPGLQASRLYKPRVLTNGDQLWEPNIDTDIFDLLLNEDGKSIYENIYTKDIVDEINIIPFHRPTIYKSFMKAMDDLVDKKLINQWKAAPYDWRLDYTDIISKDIKLENGASYNLIALFKSLAESSKSKKVTIVAHSNGGLLSKALIDEIRKENLEYLLDDVIFVAVPQLGTPKALASLLHSDEQVYLQGFIMSKKGSRLLAENMPSAYNLLPSKVYLERSTIPVVQIASGTSLSVYGTEINDASTFREFLLAFRKDRKDPGVNDFLTPNIANPTLLIRSEVTHERQDEWLPPQGITVHQVVGTGLDTLAGVKYSIERTQACNIICGDKDYLIHNPTYSRDGDGTVIALSAAAMLDQPTYYFNFPLYHNSGATHTSHANILEASPVQDLINNIITDKKIISRYFSTSTLETDQNQIRISIHSPVSIDVYDTLGNHLGISTSSVSNSSVKFIDENIPQGAYQEYGEGKYVSIPYNPNLELTFKGTDFGTATIIVDHVINNAVVSHHEHKDIPVVPDMVSNVQLGNLVQDKKLPIDFDNDGIVDIQLQSGQSTQLKKVLEKLVQHPNKGQFIKLERLLYNFLK